MFNLEFLNKSKRSGSLKAKQFFAPASDDPDNGGSGGGGGGGVSTYTNMNDYAPPHSYVDLFATPFVTYTHVVSSNTSWYMNFFKVRSGSTVWLPFPQKISTAGANITTADTTRTGSGDASFTITRPITEEGLQTDRWELYSALRDDYSYIVLQKALAIATITNLTTSSSATSIGGNTDIAIDLTNDYRFNCTDSRGRVNGVSWQILKSALDLSYQDVPCVEGIDFNLLNGTTLNQLIVDVKFLSAANYQIILTVNGYTFSSNPFYTLIGDVSTNTSKLPFNLKPDGLTTTASLEVLFPKILPILTVPDIVDETPLGGTFTTYAGQQITVQSQLNLSTGYYKTINGSVVTVITKSDTEWRQLIENKCDVVLEVVNAAGNVVLTRHGLADQTLNIPAKGNYIIHYKTLLK
jgi:hypothetical protein